MGFCLLSVLGVLFCADAEEAPLEPANAAYADPAVTRASPPASKRRDSDMSDLLSRNERRLRRPRDEWET
ncbi:hypothetical protein GCM10023191_009350 [Actinoallomurus oryzae]|uniref:Uncharacterized protein n=1 Tax=Actinoallomurus oryzae TaxID=502180 RepID=A0ABP8PE75_9ACTN